MACDSEGYGEYLNAIGEGLNQALLLYDNIKSLNSMASYTEHRECMVPDQWCEC